MNMDEHCFGGEAMHGKRRGGIVVMGPITKIKIGKCEKWIRKRLMDMK